MMNTRKSVRPARGADAEAIARISAEALGYPCATALVREKLERLNANREAVFVAEWDGTVAGFVHVERYDTLYFETMANLLGLAVRAECRGLGVGGLLLRAAEAWAGERGIGTMRLNSGISRTAAHDFYRRQGYCEDGCQLRFTKALPGPEQLPLPFQE